MNILINVHVLLDESFSLKKYLLDSLLHAWQSECLKMSNKKTKNIISISVLLAIGSIKLTKNNYFIVSTYFKNTKV